MSLTPRIPSVFNPSFARVPALGSVNLDCVPTTVRDGRGGEGTQH